MSIAQLTVGDRVSAYGRLIRFSHSIFALPFVLAMCVICAENYPFSVMQGVWILFPVVSARSAAMAFNRIVDRYIDAKNPRTAGREIPSGEVGVREAVVFCTASCLLFLLSSWQLGAHCLVVAPFVLIVLLGYSFTKRFTSYSHIVLGLALGMAPGGAWYALTSQWSWIPVPLMGAVLLWVAGFDILYSLQDEEFDKGEGLHSLPVRLGRVRALMLARVLHLVSFALLVLFGVILDFGTFYFVSILFFGLFLVRQHRLVSPNDLSRIDQAFFVENGFASIVFLFAVIGEVYIFS